MNIGSGSKPYYKRDGYESIIYPDILDIVLDRVLEYICKLIYVEDEYNLETRKKRMILADFEAGDEVAIRRSIEETFNSNTTFPFTAYNIGEEEQVEWKSHLQKMGTYYAPEIGMAVASIPHTITIPMITFYNTPSDWRRFSSIVALDDFNLTRLWCPCYFNNYLTQFPIDVDFELSKGSYAFRFDEMLKTGQIYDLPHTMRIYYHKFVLAQPSPVSGTGAQQGLSIRPVDNIELALKELKNRVSLDDPANKTIHHLTMPQAVTVTSTPVNGATNVSKTNSIAITFSQEMNQSKLLGSVDVIPYANTSLILDNPGKVLTIKINEALSANTQYEVFINKDTALSCEGASMNNDFSLKFTTGV